MGWLRDRVRNWLGVNPQQHKLKKPFDNRLWFINDDEQIRKQKLQEYLIWYSGDSDELLNYYTKGNFREFNTEPIFNRNKKDYFWSVASTEEKIKRSHSGVPRAIIETITNAIGTPFFSTQDKVVEDRINAIIKETGLYDVINQEQMPLTLVTGAGAYKINVDTNLSQKPIVTFYDARNVRFDIISRRIVGVKFIDYYQKDNKAYALTDHRYLDEGVSYIEYKLYRLKPGQHNDEWENGAEEVALGTLQETAELQDMEFVGLGYMLAVPSVFFKDNIYEGNGRSIFTGKVDLFDDLDQALSQSANTVRKSTPVEYYPVDMLERTPLGEPKLPQRYDRSYIATPAGRNGDGEQTGKLTVTQPALNFSQYTGEVMSVLSLILTGVLSPATMGIDIAKRDNADAQREKEKITIMTRNNIIAQQKEILNKVMCICLKLEDYIKNPGITGFRNYDVSVDFDEFASPTFENQLGVLSGALASGSLSIDKYVDLLWTDTLDEEEKQKEIDYIKQFMGQGANPLEALLAGAPNYAEGEVPPDETQDAVETSEVE